MKGKTFIYCLRKIKFSSESTSSMVIEKLVISFGSIPLVKILLCTMEKTLQLDKSFIFLWLFR